jgi:hypothetical protein
VESLAVVVALVLGTVVVAADVVVGIAQQEVLRVLVPSVPGPMEGGLFAAAFAVVMFAFFRTLVSITPRQNAFSPLFALVISYKLARTSEPSF